ncbi:transglycosylase-like protein with SLT domain [Pseudoroseicyclus aestuarii]|uniref:Transglycosylase-like protein with SLT domain n=1 Tax=Pseudoroseicyclus aestuarii TaxID=1795041 RepID=A0A318T9J8_9RHOB|nr:lytic transglycosylase domain-containing protein [Pseudoroseicyclus aestuarii]PYE84988.1 transglycosylase-like protein with SLT domain [Pseudoroseicyclus aestuarii]
MAACVLAPLLASAAAPVARSEPGGGDFTFRSVTPPSAGSSRRITVQIAPRAPAAPASPAAPVSDGGAAPRGAGGFAWFWSAISPQLSGSGPGRLEVALRALDAAPAGQGAPEPRLQMLQEIARAHGVDIMRATIGTRVSPALVLSVIAVESAGQSRAVSGAGAQGLMQLMPATAARFGVANSLIAPDNIRGGTAYLDWLLGHFDGDPILALAGYNAGEGSLRDAGGVPDWPETRGYVPKVLAAWRVARGLCVTPPVLIGDGCVFAVNNL